MSRSPVYPGETALCAVLLGLHVMDRPDTHETPRPSSLFPLAFLKIPRQTHFHVAARRLGHRYGLRLNRNAGNPGVLEPLVSQWCVNA